MVAFHLCHYHMSEGRLPPRTLHQNGLHFVPLSHSRARPHSGHPTTTAAGFRAQAEEYSRSRSLRMASRRTRSSCLPRSAHSRANLPLLSPPSKTVRTFGGREEEPRERLSLSYTQTHQPPLGSVSIEIDWLSRWGR